MSHLNQEYSLIVPSANANFTAHTYTEIFVGATATFVVNGVSVTAAGGSSIKLKVRTISATPNVYLLGEPSNVYSANPDLSGLS